MKKIYMDAWCAAVSCTNTLFNHIFVLCACSNVTCQVDVIFTLEGFFLCILRPSKHPMTQRNQIDGGVRLQLGIYKGHSIRNSFWETKRKGRMVSRAWRLWCVNWQCQMTVEKMFYWFPCVLNIIWCCEIISWTIWFGMVKPVDGLSPMWYQSGIVEYWGSIYNFIGMRWSNRSGMQHLLG